MDGIIKMDSIIKIQNQRSYTSPLKFQGLTNIAL